MTKQLTRGTFGGEAISGNKSLGKLTTGLFLCLNYNGATMELCEAFLRCARHYRRVGLSVCWGAAVCRNRHPSVGILCHQILLWACHLSFPPLPRTCSSSQFSQPGGPPSSLVLGDFSECLAWPTASLTDCIMFILCSGEAFFAAGCRLGPLSLSGSLYIWLLTGRSFGSSGLRMFDCFYWTFRLIHPRYSPWWSQRHAQNDQGGRQATSSLGRKRGNDSNQFNYNITLHCDRLLLLLLVSLIRWSQLTKHIWKITLHLTYMA